MLAPKERLIQGLRDAATSIKDGEVHYYWHRWESCNAGILCQKLSGMSALQIRAEIDRQRSAFSDRHWSWSRYCYGDIPVDDLVLRDFASVGLTFQSLYELEMLGNLQIQKYCALDKINPVSYRSSFCDPDSVATYMMAWADLLEAGTICLAGDHYGYPDCATGSSSAGHG
jgi:hypothetical protein